MPATKTADTVQVKLLKKAAIGGKVHDKDEAVTVTRQKAAWLMKQGLAEPADKAGK